MSVDWASETKRYFDNLPHPHAPSLKIGEFATAVKLATAMKFGGHASPHEAALFFPEFKATGMSPQEFEHTLERIAPLSFTYHGRPPTMHELASLKDKTPAEARRYFGDLPHKIYPHVSAAEMVKAVHAAKPHAMEHLGREPALPEAVYLHHSGENPGDYYQRIAQSQEPASTLPDNVLSIEKRGDAGNRGLSSSGGQAAGQRA